MKWLFFVLCLLALPFALAPVFAEDAKPKPLRVLLVTGGCCHDYKHQAKRFKEATDKLANVEWTVMLDPRTGTKGEIDLYKNPDWAKGYDVVVHNECFADTDSPEYIRKITEAHKAGVPAVVIHCAMHTYRAAKIDDWREFLGVNSFMHEHQSEYAVTPTEKGKAHPIMKGFPATWKTPKDELYVIAKEWPNMTPLATSKSERNGKEYATLWTNTYGKARVFGTTWGHGNATWDDPVFLETLVKGTLWAAGKLEDDGNPSKGYGPQAKPSADAEAKDWTKEMTAKLPKSEKPIALFNGKDLTGWEGLKDRWSVEDGVIVGRNNDAVPTSTYLFTEKKYRDFRLLFEVKQTRSPKHSTMHSAVCVLGEKFDDKGNAFGFKGPLLMFCQDWGIWDAYRRNRIEPANHGGQFHPKGVENVGEWNQIEVLVIGNRIRFAANGKMVFDFTDKPEMLKESPIGLQLHSNNQPQEYRFRGLVLTEKPEEKMVTVE